MACDAPLDGDIARLRCPPPITGGNLVACRRCATVQVMPRPKEEELRRLYDRIYYEGFEQSYGLAGGNEAVSPVLAERLIELATILGGPGRIVDLGCGVGHFVGHASRSGWEAIGIEPSVWAAEQARRQHRIAVYTSVLEEAPIEAESLDVVHANHVFEHLLHPLGTLRTAYRLLRPGGLLSIEVPQELRYPLTDRVSGWVSGEVKRPAAPVTYHLEFFSRAGLRRAALLAGFEVLHCSTVRHVRSRASRLPFGAAAKAVLYWMEERLGNAPDLVLLARRPNSGQVGS